MPLTPDEAAKLAAEILDDPEVAASEGRRDVSLSSLHGGSRPLPEQIGNYRILGIIAAGGMGIVYAAQQEHPKRPVALKVMKQGIASPRALEWFKHEAEILGRLRHPGIAQIYEAGMHDDGSGAVPFFAMEYIPDAKPITRYAIDSNLSVRQRLELFAEACDGVQHGHQKEIIHRDLKPDNILVDETGQPRIIDFGVARATDSDLTITTMQADVRQLVGTLQYMSPEQCSGNPHEIDVRSDVYSLGVVLYELLSGRLPYDLSNTPVPHATRIIQEFDPPRPGTITKAFRGNIEAILLTALQKDPRKRYSSAASLALDVRRHLSGEPIEARRPSRWARTVRWVARSPVLATTTACLLIVLATTVASALSVHYLRRRPHDVHTTDDGREVRLLAISRDILHTWTTPAKGGITFARLARSPPHQRRPGRLVLVGFNHAATNPFPGELCAFDVEDDLDSPVWTARIEADSVPTDLPGTGVSLDGFGVANGLVDDFFPERPGEEVFVTFQHTPSSPCCLRIYGTDGGMLYQAWHNGSVGYVYWWPAPRLLVCAALNSEVYWEERGYPNVQTPHPRVVFALRPRSGHLGAGWTSPADDADRSTLAWYRCMLPPALTDMLVIDALGPPHSGRDGDTFVMVEFRLPDRLERRHVLLDAEGTMQPALSTSNDAWKRLPESERHVLEGVHLGDLPPIVVTAGGTG